MKLVSDSEEIKRMLEKRKKDRGDKGIKEMEEVKSSTKLNNPKRGFWILSLVGD